MSDDTIHCRRCGADAPPMAKAPFKTELGERILAQICAGCWKDWLQHQTLLINHYGLDPRDARAREFLYQQVEEVLLGEADAEPVDTSQKGAIEW
jgi:Fe-S cluster biosynthesis and repair protein YggX